MARKLRIEYEGALYHVMNTGIDRRRLFFDEADFERMLLNMEECVGHYGVRMYGYACMDNHFHFALRTPHGNLSRFMQSLQTRYSVYFNLRHRRSGHVFRGPYKALLVEDGDYLLQLSRYIHLNPVRTQAWKSRTLKERIAALREYRWSSYPQYTGRRRPLEWMDYQVLADEVEARFGRKRGGFRRFVEGGLAENSEDMEDEIAAADLALGSDEFVASTAALYDEMLHDEVRRREDVARRSPQRRVAIDTVLDEVCRHLGVEVEDLRRRRGGASWRGVAARMLVRFAGLTQREVAEVLGVGTGAAICIRLRDLEDRMVSDSSLASTIRRLEQRLTKMESRG